MVVSVTGFDDDGEPFSQRVVKDDLDAYLRLKENESCDRVANTLFPVSMWNPKEPRSQLFERYGAIKNRLLSYEKNKYGLYFERMCFGGNQNQCDGNQLDFIIEAFKRKGARRSYLQVGIFDPTRDHTRAALRGFPCLQHLSFAKFDESLQVNAFYAVQHVDTKAYGNYIGLCRVGKFVAHELGLRLNRMTCLTGIMALNGSKSGIQKIGEDCYGT